MENGLNIALMGKRLRTCRTACNQTMTEFAERCNISERYLADIEHGLKVPKLETCVRIANAAGVSMDYLLQDSLTKIDKENLILFSLNTLSPKQKSLFQNFIIQLVEGINE